jgi:glycosyltransferase involved in cell wall biosynthesis
LIRSTRIISTPDGVAAVLLGRTLGRPVVVTARGSDLNVIAEYAVPRRWLLWSARQADGLVAVSSGLKRRLATLGIAEECVHMLCNGVDLALFRPTDRDMSRRALGLIRPALLAVGNLVGLKRHRMMVEALVGLPAVDLVIVGEGRERAAIEALAPSAESPTVFACSVICHRIALRTSTTRPTCCCSS